MEGQGTRNHFTGHSVWVEPRRPSHSTERRKSLIITNNMTTNIQILMLLLIINMTLITFLECLLIPSSVFRE